jgi:mxaK protein
MAAKTALSNVYSGVAGRIASLSRPALLWLLLAGSLAVLMASAWLWFEKYRANTTIAALLGGENIEIDIAAAPPAVLLAREYYLLARDRLDEAQPVVDQAAWRSDPDTRPALLYNIANARVRMAFAAIGEGKFERAIALIVLAKDEYRQALRFKPEAWDARYNLDVALRLWRDLPQAMIGEDDEPKDLPVELWSDLPGVPKGEP